MTNLIQRCTNHKALSLTIICIMLVTLLPVFGCGTTTTITERHTTTTTATTTATVTQIIQTPVITTTITKTTTNDTVVIGNAGDAEMLVVQYLCSDAATTYYGQQVLAAFMDAREIGAYEGDYYAHTNGGWEVSSYFDTWAIEESPLLAPVITEISLCGPNEREAYDTVWYISPTGAVEPLNGNAIRLVAEMQKLG